MPVKPVKIDLISGFLGAGKTTLMKKLLESKPSSEKIAVIENEFGSVGIDGRLLKGTGVSVREINSGCICCTLAGNFAAALREVVKKYEPDRVMIEPSGVGKLSEIIDSCRRALPGRDCAFGICVAVVDATKYAMYEKNFSEFFLDQIKSAKTVVLSRTQKAPPEKVERAVEGIRKHNPGANIVTTPWDRLSAGKILSVAEGRMPELIEGARSGPDSIPGEDGHHDHEHCHDADQAFEVWSIETPQKFQAGRIGEALRRITRYGTVLRAKGIVPVGDGKWIQFDYVPGENSLRETDADYTGRLCVIGQNLDPDGLASLFGVSGCRAKGSFSAGGSADRRIPR